MRNLVNWLIGLTLLCFAASCSNDEPTPAELWKARNEAAFHQVYTEAQAAIAAGSTQWRIIKNYATTLDATEKNCIVVRIDRQGTGSGCPLYTDSVRVNYQGRLIPTLEQEKQGLPGTQFDHSGFYADSLSIFSLDYCVPTTFCVSNTVDGFTTALQHMHIGDQWRVYMPYQLGYNANATGQVPAYSLLQFDIQLLQFARKGNSLPAWR